jgi:glycosyltransferase involved in cell wall biosynthesis
VGVIKKTISVINQALVALRFVHTVVRASGFRSAFAIAFVVIRSSASLWGRFLFKTVKSRRHLERLFDAGLARFSSDDLVSVVLPVNNGRSKGVERLVLSLKAQTHENIELIAVDSGSTDDTVSFLKAEGFKVIEIPPASFNHAFSRNTGAAQATGKYLLFVVDDVVFDDPNWLTTAIFLLEHFSADSISSRQSIDENADAYARLLDRFLSNAQAVGPTISVSRQGILSRYLFKRLYLGAKYRSIAIDDTNHLVRRATFDRLKFRAPTVEDIDFATRLFETGGKVVHTNLLSVRHYHQYNLGTLEKYAKRVYLDTQIMAPWQPMGLKLASRESFLLAAYLGLVVALVALSRYVEKRKILSDYRQPFRDPDVVEAGDIFHVIEICYKIKSSNLYSFALSYHSEAKAAAEIFSRVIGGCVASNLYYSRPICDYVVDYFLSSLFSAREAIETFDNEKMTVAEFRSVIIFLWVQRVFAHLSRANIFERVEVSRCFDDWKMENWS